MSDQQPPAWNPEHRPTGPYGAPPPPPPPGTPSQPYGAPPQHTAPLPQYGRPPQHSQPPRHAVPRPQYGGQSPQYGPQPQQYAGQPPQYAGQPPQYDPYRAQPPAQPPAKGPKRPKGPWLAATAAAVVLALVGGAVVLLTRGDDTAEADAPGATATYTDGITTPGVTPTTELPPTEPPSTEPPSTEPPTTEPPSTPPGVGERRRTLKDIDVGVAVYDDIYVAPAKGWRKTDSTTRSVLLETSAMPGAVLVVVSPAGWPARLGVAQAVDEMIAADRMKGVKKGDVHTMPPANSNIGSQAEQPYSGRVTTGNGVVVSLVARCTTMSGVETVHNVTVTLCAAATKESKTAVFRAADRMLASVARSI